MKFFNDICAQQARQNTYFRKVLYTTPHTQLVLMSVLSGDNIPQEVHQVDQIITIVEGKAEAILNGETTSLEPGSVLIIPAGTEHFINNTGPQDLKLYTFYAPPEHAPDTVHKTKEDDSHS